MEVQDDPLWKLARKRADFKKHILVYIVINAFLWAVWFFTTPMGYIWPIWASLGWGIGLVFNYFDAYHLSTEEMTRKEYEKLKNQQK